MCLNSPWYLEHYPIAAVATRNTHAQNMRTIRYNISNTQTR